MTAQQIPVSGSGYTALTDERSASSVLLRSRRAAWAGGVGTVIEYYDYSLYGFLAVAIAPLFFPNSDPTVALMSALLLFATGFLLRPIGGLIFGRIGDRYGRKRALVATLLTMGVASTAIGLVPTYATLGVWATVLLVLCRGVQGLSAGGELGGSMTFIAESSDPRKRGSYGAASAVGITVGFASAGAVAGSLSLVLTAEQFGSWGWRIPFLLTLPLCLFCLWLRRRSEETLVESDGRRSRGSLRELVLEDRGGLALTTLASIAVNGTTYIGLGYLTIHLIRVLEMDPTAVYWIAVVAISTAGVAALGAGRLADRVGMMKVTALGMGAFAVMSLPAFALMTTGDIPAVLLAYSTLISLAIFAATPVLATVPLLFRAEHRYTGTALGWNLGAITAGATTPVVAFWLVDRFSSPLAPVGVCLLGAALGLLAAHLIHRASKERGIV